MPSKMTAIPSIVLALAASNVAAQPITGVDLTEHADLVKQACARDSSCRSESILAITNRTGNAATCVSSTLDNTSLLFSDPRFYLMYGYKSTCSFPVAVHAKINNKWHEDVGTVRPGTSATVSLLYQDSTGRGPSVVMFCRLPGTPRDDLTCTGDAASVTPEARTSSESFQYFAQVKFANSRDFATAVVAELSRRGFAANITEVATGGYRIRVGPFSSAEEVRAVADSIRATQVPAFQETAVVRVRK